MHIKIFITLFIFSLSSPAWSQELCPLLKNGPHGSAPELKVKESDLSLSYAMESIDWLEKDAWEVIKKFKTTNELLSCTECFGIPFPNAVATIKGTIMRQEALLQLERLEISKLKLKSGSGNSKDVEAAQLRFDKAKKVYCEFLDASELAD